MSFSKVATISLLALLCSCSLLMRGTKSSLMPSDVGYTDDAEVTFYYIEGLKLADVDPNRAAIIFSRALELDSTHHPSSFEMAKLSAVTDPANARRYCEAAIRGDSTNIWYRSFLGRIMISDTKYSEALTLYTDLVANEKPNIENDRILAALYEQNGQPFSAITVLDSAEMKFGRQEQIIDFKRQLLIRLKLFDKAVAEAQAMVNDNPFDELAYARLAEVYAAMKKDSLAEASYTTALKINPSNVEVLVALNEFYRDRGDNENFLATAKKIFMLDEVELKAKIDFFKEITANEEQYRSFFFQISDLISTLVIKYPNDYDILNLYANHMVKSGNIAEALKIYKSFVENNPPRIEAFNNILDIEAYLKKSDSVELWSARAIAAFPQNSDLYIRRGSAQQYMGELPKAIESYSQALRYAANDSVRSAVIGIIGDMEYAKNGALRKAYSKYDKALRLDPDNAMVLNNYAYFLAEQGKRLPKALEMTKRCNKLAPTNPTFLDTQAWVLYKMEQYADSKRIMQQAISLDRSNSSELSLHYGDILDALGEDYMAQFYWRKALEQGAEAKAVEKRFKEQKMRK